MLVLLKKVSFLQGKVIDGNVIHYFVVELMGETKFRAPSADLNCFSHLKHEFMFEFLKQFSYLPSSIFNRIIILGMMSAFLLYKIHYLNVIFVERDGNAQS